jgi:ATP-dependent Clp protease ATP-binding subunit ClpA
VASGLTPRERAFCAYLLVGPTGTGKTQLVRTLARTLHGDDGRLVVADCARILPDDPWQALAAQLAPLFGVATSNGWGTLEAPPLSILLIEHLERGSAEIFQALAAALESGQIMLPPGRRGNLRNCLIFLTTGLCSREILDQSPRIGFTMALTDDENEADKKLHQVCLERAQQEFGTDFVAQLDGLLVFHKLEPAHLAESLDRRVARVSQWMAARGFGCEMRPAAREFLLERGGGDLRRGARDLVNVHRKFVEFPLADLMISRRIPPGGLVVVDRRPGEAHLHFTVTPPQDAVSAGSARTAPTREVPVVWDPGATIHRPDSPPVTQRG